jgi:FkbM family methyltransferase
MEIIFMKKIPDKWFDRYLPYYAKIKELIPDDAKIFIVGANDGITYDPIYRVWNPNWHGFYVEPNPAAMENLKKNITFPKSTFIPYAIGKYDCLLTLHVMSKKAATAYEHSAHIDGSSISSANYDHVAKGLKKRATDFVKSNKGMKGLISSISVPCKIFGSVINEFQINRLDLVQIDVEEMDDIVVESLLDSFPLLSKEPNIILYEHQRTTREQKEKTQKLLRSFGYKIVPLRNDTMGYKE